MIDALLLYPRLGSMDSIIVELPLSIIYAAAESNRRGYKIKLIDLRRERPDWQKVIDPIIEQGVRLVGISVMTGMPLESARKISQHIKDKFPDTPVVWGGPHATVLPETIEETFIDILVRGDGSLTLANLIATLKTDQPDLSSIPGISYKDAEGTAVHNDRSNQFERIHYSDIPYHLLDVDSEDYQRVYKGGKQRLFPIFTTVGCPYKCTFCVSPAIYKEINGKKWLPDSVDDVIAHIEFLIARYSVTHLSIIDDTSFVNLKRMGEIFEKIVEKNIHVNLEFRGARINEIDKMDDDFLDLMVAAGGRVIMVGVESASDRILQKMQKGISKEQIIRINQKLARHPELIPHYNFLYGTPGEKYADLIETKEVVLQLLEDNKNAYFGVGSDWKPIPGSVMLEVAERDFNYVGPKTLDEWIEMDHFDGAEKIRHSWYSDRFNNMTKLMQLSAFVIDDKLIKESLGNNSLFFITVRLASKIYKPIAKFRMRYNLHQFMIEFYIYRAVVHLLSIWQRAK
ncbi:MAG: B12-binding domain-containing radical SAM protein [Magnetococcales bacterium]|nr:B12-binding domain-containing radical SAM protein [Magnetococcales bacterium]